MKKHSHFLSLIFLIAAFSLYAIVSSFLANNSYLNQRYAAVVKVKDNNVSTKIENSDNSGKLKRVTLSNSGEAGDSLDSGEAGDSANSGGSGGSAAQKKSKSVIPPECVSCPPFPICANSCPAKNVIQTDEKEIVYPIFTDVYSDHPYALAIESLLNAGIVAGYKDGSFKPDNKINRAELLTILVKATDGDLSLGTFDSCFIDANDQWFTAFVCYAKFKNWVKGYGDGTFKPDQDLIKAEALKIIMAAFDLNVPKNVTGASFSDVSVKDWFAPYVEIALEKGIISHKKFFSPNFPIKRGEVAQMIFNVQNLE